MYIFNRDAPTFHRLVSFLLNYFGSVEAGRISSWHKYESLSLKAYLFIHVKEKLIEQIQFSEYNLDFRGFPLVEI